MRTFTLILAAAWLAAALGACNHPTSFTSEYFGHYYAPRAPKMEDVRLGSKRILVYRRRIRQSHKSAMNLSTPNCLPDWMSSPPRINYARND